MLDLRLCLAILSGKLISIILKKTNSGATAAPGLLALKIDPGLVSRLASQLDKNIIISGTNGKTTTARMTASIFKNADIKFIHNRAGSNLERGIASTLLTTASIFGQLPKNHWGLWETDEAVFPIASQKLKPDIVLLTNLFRDQLDRYGEIDTVARAWKKTLKNLPTKTVKILNADDPVVASLGKDIGNVQYFGLDENIPNQDKIDHSWDSTFCPYCHSPLKYRKSFVGHLGKYSCPSCGQIQPKINKQSLNFQSSLPGIYNLYNFSAAAAAAINLAIPKNIIAKSLTNFKPAFGRVEKIAYLGKQIKIFLVKNPTGFNQVINTITQSREKTTCLIAINDLIADGRDVSWLWDVNFEKLVACLNTGIVSGIRAYDMALRLKYAGCTSIIEPDLEKAINQLLAKSDKQLYILPTYTAMLKIRKILNKMGLVHSSWSD